MCAGCCLIGYLFLYVMALMSRDRMVGWAWRRVTAEQKDRLIKLYRCAVEGAVLLIALGLYRCVFRRQSPIIDDLFKSPDLPSVSRFS